MKKKVFRERYSLVIDGKAGKLNIPKLDIEEIKNNKKELEEKKTSKRGRKNVKSNK